MGGESGGERTERWEVRGLRGERTERWEVRVEVRGLRGGR